MSASWLHLGEFPPARLAAARQQAHWAAQVLSAAGETFAPHVPDTSHTAMHWDAARAALVGRPLGGARLGLHPADLTLFAFREGSGPGAERPLAGRTLAEALAWAAAAVAPPGRPPRPLVRPDYELPPHPIAAGGRFERAPGLEELSRWFANADTVLRRFARETPGAGEVLCWPHHFDIASLVTLEADADGEALRSVGVGLSPGDEMVPEPYWYVNHDPQPEDEALPPLAAGEWIVDGDYHGAVLRAGDLVAAGGAEAQERRLAAFLGSAVAASRALALAAPV